MKKTITIEGADLTLSNNVSWLMEYREQFGHDIVPDLLPVVSAILKLFSSISAQSGKPIVEVINSLDEDTVQGALIELAGVQSVDFLNVVWAMAKACDDDIDEPKRWFKQFDSFPIDIVAPAVWELVLSGFVSSKNLNRLSETGATKKSVSTKSSLQESNEGSKLPTSEE